MRRYFHRCVTTPNIVLSRPACTPRCTAGFSACGSYHEASKADLRISVKDDRRDKTLNVLRSGGQTASMRSAGSSAAVLSAPPWLRLKFRTPRPSSPIRERAVSGTGSASFPCPGALGPGVLSAALSCPPALLFKAVFAACANPPARGVSLARRPAGSPAYRLTCSRSPPARTGETPCPASAAAAPRQVFRGSNCSF